MSRRIHFEPYGEESPFNVLRPYVKEHEPRPDGRFDYKPGHVKGDEIIQSLSLTRLYFPTDQELREVTADALLGTRNALIHQAPDSFSVLQRTVRDLPLHLQDALLTERKLFSFGLSRYGKPGNSYVVLDLTTHGNERLGNETYTSFGLRVDHVGSIAWDTIEAAIHEREAGSSEFFFEGQHGLYSFAWNLVSRLREPLVFPEALGKIEDVTAMSTAAYLVECLTHHGYHL